MTTLDFTDDEKLALVAHPRQAIEYDPYPFAPRLDPLKAILANLRGIIAAAEAEFERIRRIEEEDEDRAA
jgi:hypothetical protein